MFCENCGKEVLNGSSFCENCGASFNTNTNSFSPNDMPSGSFYNPNVGNVNNNVKSGTTNVLAIVGFILSLVGILASCATCIGLLFGIAGLILGIIAKKQIKATPDQGGNGLATAAIIISIVDIVLSIALSLIVMIPIIMSNSLYY